MNQKEMAVIGGCGLFAGLSQEEIQRLLGCVHAEEVHFEKNEILWHMGDGVTSCALILSGAVRAETVNSAGEHSLMAYHPAGALVGDVLMATPGGVSPVYVIAAEPVTAVFLPFHALMGGCERSCPAHARLRENLVAEIARKYWAQRARAGYLSEHSLRRRIALYFSDRCKTGQTFSLGGTREDLADFLCVNRSALSRELSRMKAEGILDYYKDTFRILSMEKLEACVL